MRMHLLDQRRHRRCIPMRIAKQATGPVERHPAHDLAIDVMRWLLATLPKIVTGLAPVGGYVFAGAAYRFDQLHAKGLTRAMTGIQPIQQLAEHIELPLEIGRVAGSDRAAVCEATESPMLFFDEICFAAQAKDNLRR